MNSGPSIVSSHRFTCFTLAQRKDYRMVETRPLGCGWRLFFVVGLSLSFSPPSDCISLPSMMTWAPCPHGVRTRGKKRSKKGKAKHGEVPMPASMHLNKCEQLDKPQWLRFLPPNANEKRRLARSHTLDRQRSDDSGDGLLLCCFDFASQAQESSGGLTINNLVSPQE